MMEESGDPLRGVYEGGEWFASHSLWLSLISRSLGASHLGGIVDARTEM